MNSTDFDNILYPGFLCGSLGAGTGALMGFSLGMLNTNGTSIKIYTTVMVVGTLVGNFYPF